MNPRYNCSGDDGPTSCAIRCGCGHMVIFTLASSAAPRGSVRCDECGELLAFDLDPEGKDE